MNCLEHKNTSMLVFIFAFLWFYTFVCLLVNCNCQWTYLYAEFQVCSVLESLDREYRRDEDWCNTDKAAAIEDKVAYIQQLINKHQEQKEAFLKVCILISLNLLGSVAAVASNLWQFWLNETLALLYLLQIHTGIILFGYWLQTLKQGCWKFNIQNLSAWTF